MNTETEELRRRAHAGDRSALGRLMTNSVAALTRWAHRRLPAWVRSVADTGDLVQDAILRTLNRIDSIDLRNRGALQAYLRRAVINRINDEFRRVARRGMAEPLGNEQVSQGPSPYDEAVASDLEARYKAALRQLRERDRLLVVGHVELEYSVEQLACMTNRNVAATRVALRRALLRLAAAMEQGSSEAGAGIVD